MTAIDLSPLAECARLVLEVHPPHCPDREFAEVWLKADLPACTAVTVPEVTR